jgi:hypothetical protein
MKTVLSAANDSGHIKMVPPVAQALANSIKAKPLMIARRTGRPRCWLGRLQVKDFVTTAGVATLQLGRQVAQEIEGLVDDPQVSITYLGSPRVDFVDAVGADPAEASYRKFGRKAFLPSRRLVRCCLGAHPIQRRRQIRRARSAVKFSPIS